VNCFKCGEILKARKAPIVGEYAGESFTVTADALVCKKCGYKTVHATKLDEYRRLLADAYREKKELLTSEEIRNIRNRLDMSQEQFAAYLGVGVASIKRWELGQVQDKSMDQLIRLKCNPRTAEENFRDVRLRAGGEPDEFNGYAAFSIVKLANTILFFLEAAPNERRQLSILPLNKLLWYVDAEHFKAYGVSITGTCYARLPYGPVPDDYTLIYRELESLGYISTQGMYLKPKRLHDSSVLSSTEVACLNKVWKRFHKKLAQIVRESHTEPAWTDTPHAQLISFKKVQSGKAKLKVAV